MGGWSLARQQAGWGLGRLLFGACRIVFRAIAGHQPDADQRQHHHDSDQLPGTGAALRFAVGDFGFNQGFMHWPGALFQFWLAGGIIPDSVTAGKETT